MLFLIALALAFIIAYFCDKPLKKYPYAFYITAAVVTVAVIVVSQLITNRTITVESVLIKNYLIGIFSKGAFAAALWCIVMWAGALPNGSALIKKIMPIRGELSIFAATVTLAHAVTYGIMYIKSIMINIEHDRTPTSEFVITCIVCVVLMLIMIPLTVMSFKTIRKKMSPRLWKNIQRAAYVFYALIYIHIMVLYVPQARLGRSEKFVSIIVYSIVFISYAVFRLRKLYVKKKKPEKATVLNVICVAAILLLVAGAAALSYGKAPERSIPAQSSETNAAVTTAASTVSGEVTETTAATTVSGGTGVSTSTDTTGTGSTGTTDFTVSDPEEESSEAETETTPAEEQPEEGGNSEEPQQQEEPAPEPEPEYIFNNGTYTGTGMGYLGDVHVTITIENDVITSISAYADADDPEYFDDAWNYIRGQIQSSVSADGIDARSEATFSSNGIIDAARQALSQARK